MTTDRDRLEKLFHEAMLEIYKRAKKECHYNPGYFLRMVSEEGGVQTARKLLATDKPSEGFTALWECGRLDLTVEAYVLKPEFAPLFTETEQETARQRLITYKYKF